MGLCKQFMVPESLTYLSGMWDICSVRGIKSAVECSRRVNMSDQPYKVIKHAGLTIEIYPDESAQSPDDCRDDSLFLMADHRDFYVRGKDYTEDRVEVLSETHWIFGLEAYIHSGIKLALSSEGNFVDRNWDVSQLGVVCASKKEWETQEKAKEAARSLVNEWNTYLEGDVWGYVIKDKDGEDLDSCWGCYEDEWCEKAAKESAECLAKDIKTKKEAKTTHMPILENTKSAMIGLIDDWMADHPTADERDLDGAVDDVVTSCFIMSEELKTWVVRWLVRKELKKRFDDLF